MELRIQWQDSGAVAVLAVLAVYGELDLDGGPQRRQALLQAIDDNHGRRVVVDLEGVDFVDSAGLGVLVGSLKRAEQRRRPRASSRARQPRAAGAPIGAAPPRRGAVHTWETPAGVIEDQINVELRRDLTVSNLRAAIVGHHTIRNRGRVTPSAALSRPTRSNWPARASR